MVRPVSVENLMVRPLRILLWGSLVVFLACAGSARQAKAPADPARIREEFDPQALSDDDFLLQPAPSVPAAAGRRAAGRRQAPSRAGDGYRVQIVAVGERPRAHALRAEVEDQLKVPAYVSYDEQARLYKIQAGNFKSADEAERLRQQAKAMGYGEAFVVRARTEAPVRQ